MALTPIIGLEIHVQLKTKSKMFCRCDNSGENQPPNTTICPVCLGQPGILPVANRQAIAWSAMAALALNCEIPAISKFDRKSYFYPDLPKGYQISQYDQPIGLKGYLEIETKDGQKIIGINRLHLEEDAAKNFHSTDGKDTLVDYNRSGTPLMEIVTEPDLRTAAEAKTFMQELRLLIRYLEISDADMEKGHLRCDANISLTDQLASPNPERSEGEGGPADKIDYKKLSPKTEVKNINSFRAVEKAVAYEIKRQTELWQNGQAPKTQSTRGWNEDKGITEEQRTKEEASDYRYFPEPDLPPLNFTPGAADGFNLKKIKASLPELPPDKRKRFAAEYGLTAENARILVEDKNLAAYFEQVISELRGWLISLDETEGTKEEIWEKNKAKLAKLAANWLLNKLLAISPQARENITPENFAEFITLVQANKINSTIAQKLLEKMVQTKKDPSVILDEEGLDKGVEQKDLKAVIAQILAQNQKEVAAYKQGKTTLLQFFIGCAMRQTKGQADPETLKNILITKLNS